MRVLGIDCGTECTGFGIVDQGSRHELMYVASGVIRQEKKHKLPERLVHVYGSLTALIDEHRPDVVAIEEVFYSVNAKSALKLGQVRGVALLAAGAHRVQVAEYAPLSIKSAVVGYGLADKVQVQQMVRRLLDLPEPPPPADAADALAIAICHLHTNGTLTRLSAGAAKR